jgi:hypothetical protein
MGEAAGVAVGAVVEDGEAGAADGDIVAAVEGAGDCAIGKRRAV